MRVQMTFFGESDGRQTVIPGLGWIPIELPFSKSTRSSTKSSWIKSYDCLKLTLLFSREMTSWTSCKRILDQTFKMAQTCALYQLKKACRIDACVYAYIPWRVHLWRTQEGATRASFRRTQRRRRVYLFNARMRPTRVSFGRTQGGSTRVSFGRTHGGSTLASFGRTQGGWRAHLWRVHLRRV